MMIALHREEEFKLHLRAALGNGVTVAELARADPARRRLCRRARRQRRDALGARSAREEEVRRAAVGWAKRSVPTVIGAGARNGGHASLCPPYSERRDR